MFLLSVQAGKRLNPPGVKIEGLQIEYVGPGPQPSNWPSVLEVSVLLNLSDLLRQRGCTTPPKPSTNEKLNSVALSDTSEEEQAEDLSVYLEDLSQDIYLFLADRRSAAGKMQSALGFYEAYANEADDPLGICERAYELLLRCDLRRLPVSRADFTSGFVDFEDSGGFYLEGRVPPKKDFPFFGDQLALVGVAATAYGNAWLHYEARWSKWLDENDPEAEPSWEHSFQEILALEGLRASFMELGEAEVLRAIPAEYASLSNDWPQIGYWVIEEIDIHFRELQAFLRGVDSGGGSGSTARSAEDWLGRRQQWRNRMEQLAEAVRSSGFSEARVDEILAEYRDVTEQLLAEDPERDRHAAEERLSSQLGSSWYSLPSNVSRLLIEAELLRSILHSRTNDWYPIIIAYARSAELLLRSLAPALEKAQISAPSGREWRNATLGDFLWLFTRDIFSGLRLGSLNPSLVSQEVRVLSELNRLRNEAAHGGNRITAAEAGRLRASLLKADGLISRLARIQ